MPRRLIDVEIAEISAVEAGSNPLADKVMHKMCDTVNIDDPHQKGAPIVTDQLKKDLETKTAALEKANQDLDELKKAHDELTAKVAEMEKAKPAETETVVEKSAVEIAVEKATADMQKQIDATNEALAFEKAKPLAGDYFKGHGGDSDVMTKAFRFIQGAPDDVKDYLKSVVDGGAAAKVAVTGEVGTRADGVTDATTNYEKMVKAYAAEKGVSIAAAQAEVHKTEAGKAAYIEMRKNEMRIA